MKKTPLITLFLFIASIALSQSISPHFFGQNAWMPSWAYNGKLDDIWQKAKPGNLEIIRIGGINYEDNFDEHIDDYIRFIDSIQTTCVAEPILQIPRYYTAEQTSNLYRLINDTNLKNVKYWSIGNEPDYHLPNSLAEISEYFVRIAKALKDLNDSIIVIGPDYANYWVHPDDQWDAGKTVYSDFINAVGMEMNTSKTAYLLDVFSFHNYVGYTIDATIDNQNIKKVIDNLSSTLTQINNKRSEGRNNKATWGIGEFNINQNNEESRKPWSFYAGQYLAMMYGVGMEKRASFICPWSLIEGEYRKSTDLSMFENEANNYLPRSTFYHLKMLTDNRHDNFMKSTSSEKKVKLVGMKDENGSTLMIMNTDTKGYSTRINLNLETTTTPDELNLSIDAGFNLEYRDYIPQNASITLVFDNQGNFVTKTLYTETIAENFNPPVVVNLVPLATKELAQKDFMFYFQDESNTIIFKGSVENDLKEVSISDLSGKKIIKKKTREKSIKIDFLQKGVYLVTVKTSVKIETGKFIKR